MLVPLLDYCFVEKQGGKRDFVCPIGPNNFEMVFTILAKKIAVEIEISVI